MHASGDVSLATNLGVPRSTASYWRKHAPPAVVSNEALSMREVELQAEVLALRRKLARVVAVLRLVLVLVRLAGARLHAQHLAAGTERDGASFARSSEAAWRSA